MASKLEIDSLTIRNSGNIFSSTLDGNVGDFVWSGSYLYICVAENSWKRVAVASWSAPDQVTGLTADDVGDTTIDLSWNAPSSDDPITDYIIEYTTGQNTLTVFVGSNTTSYQLTNLVTDSEYSIRVAAISSAGTGTYSVTITETPGLFDPASITGLQLWLDASDASTLYDATTGGSLVAADGGVARWEDKSGNGNHATQGTGGSQPLRKESVINGLDVMRFDGTDDFLAADGLTSSISDLSGSLTFFAVVSRDSTGRTDQIFTLFGPAEGSDVNSDGLQFYYTSAQLLTAQSRQYDSGFNDKICQSNATTAAPALLTFRGLSSSSWRVNGTDITAPGTTTALTFASGVSLSLATVGARRRGDTPDVAQYFDGDVCELVIYNSALSDTDREAVENYLIAKWGIT